MKNIMNTLQLLKERELRAKRQRDARGHVVPMNRSLDYHTSAHQSPAARCGVRIGSLGEAG